MDREFLRDELMFLADYGQALERPEIVHAAESCLRELEESGERRKKSYEGGDKLGNGR